MTQGDVDHEIRSIQTQLDGLAEALLVIVNDHKLDDAQRATFRNLARAAVTRSTKLPTLALDDRVAWLHRTQMFADAVSMVLLEYLKVQLE